MGSGSDRVGASELSRGAELFGSRTRIDERGRKRTTTEFGEDGRSGRGRGRELRGRSLRLRVVHFGFDWDLNAPSGLEALLDVC